MQELDIRYSEISDGEHLLKWMQDKEVAKCFPPSTEKEMNDFVNNWIGFSRYKVSLTAVLDKEVCGIGTLFLMPYKKVSHQCVLYMVVDPLKTGRGIGTDLLKNMLNLAENYFKFEFITAEVFEGSPIIKLLEKFKFERYAVQEKYVKMDGLYNSRILYQLFFRG